MRGQCIAAECMKRGDREAFLNCKNKLIEEFNLLVINEKKINCWHRTTHCENIEYMLYLSKSDAREQFIMEIPKLIKDLRKGSGMNRKEFSEHTGIPVRTLEDWEAGRRTPPEYIPRLIAFQLKYEELIKEKGDADGKNN